MQSWTDNLVTTPAEIAQLLEEVQTIAVVGIRSEACAGMPTHYVPAYMANAGFQVIPVPVYEPRVTEILGQPVYRSLTAVPHEVDLVNVFRRPDDIPAHVPDILAKQPKAVWF